MSEKHSYSYVIGNEKRGRYLSKNPNESARKALKQIFKETGRNPKRITMVLNNGKKDKFYDYKTDIFELEKPIVRNINGKIVEYKYDFKVTRI